MNLEHGQIPPHALMHFIQVIKITMKLQKPLYNQHGRFLAVALDTEFKLSKKFYSQPNKSKL